MSIDKSWLGDAFQFQEKQGLYAQVSASGAVETFGFYGPERTIVVDLRAETATETKSDVERFQREEADEVSFDDWLSDWRESVVAASQAGGFSFELRCSFCGKNNNEVRKLIAGPTVYICDECVALCQEIIAAEGP